MSNNTSEPGAIVGEKSAKLIGGILTVISVLLAAGALWTLGSAIGKFIFVFLALYVLGILFQFWFTGSWKNGLTVNELLLSLAWFVGFAKILKAGNLRRNMLSSLQAQHIKAEDDDSKVLLSQTWAIVAGAAASVVFAVLLVPAVLRSIVGLTGDLIWLLVVGYFVGLVFTFWTSKSYKNGLTLGEIVLVVLWPADFVKKFIAGVRAKFSGGSSSSVTQPNSGLGTATPQRPFFRSWL